MNDFECYLPHLHFGAGKLRMLGELSKHLGTKALLAIDPFLDAAGLSQQVVSILLDASMEAVICTDIQPNPDCFAADRAAEVAREHGCQFVIAVGGGSAMDFGKGVAVVCANGGSCWQYTERRDHEVMRLQRVLPMVAVPTTAGTGSEATPFAVFNNPKIKEKSTIVNDQIFPMISVVDPELMRSMPPPLTASTGFDAAAHALEAYISRKSNPFCRMVALEAIRGVSENLRKAVADGSDTAARSEMAWAATLGGAAISQIGVTLPHAMAQPVGGLTGAGHGETIAAVMVKVLEDSYEADPQSFADVAEALEPEIADRPLREKAERCPILVRQLLQDIGIHVRLSDFGMARKDIEKATEIALRNYYFDIQSHPMEVDKKKIQEIYEECL
jgi:alcohol dehydrogenase class IV